MFKLWWYEFEKGKKSEFQDHLNVFFEKSLDLDYKNGFSFTHFGLMYCAFAH